jgi:hypothetical protein
MADLISLPASSVSREELRDILSEYLALDRARVFRRLFVQRFGLLAAASAVVSFIVPGLSTIARWLPPALFLAPPAWAWMVELRLAHRFAGHVASHEKVVKCS